MPGVIDLPLDRTNSTVAGRRFLAVARGCHQHREDQPGSAASRVTISSLFFSSRDPASGSAVGTPHPGRLSSRPRRRASAVRTEQNSTRADSGAVESGDAQTSSHPPRPGKFLGLHSASAKTGISYSGDSRRPGRKCHSPATFRQYPGCSFAGSTRWTARCSTLLVLLGGPQA